MRRCAKISRGIQVIIAQSGGKFTIFGEKETVIHPDGVTSETEVAPTATERQAKFGFLGPHGTFTEEALLSWKGPDPEDVIAYPTIPEVLLGVDRGEVEQGIVPIENSIEGSVNATIDMLIFEVDVQIVSEMVFAVDHNLLVRPGVGLGDVKGVFSQPHATAQCRRFLTQALKDVPLFAANSTADAAKLVSEDPRPLAAIGTELAAQLYGLEVLHSRIQDVADNATRFVIVSRDDPPRTGRDKTSLVCFIEVDRPGSLLQILQEFAYRQINLTKVESRPTKQRLGEYCFFIEMEGHAEDREVADAIKCLKCKLPHLKVLGSYPRWSEGASDA